MSKLTILLTLTLLALLGAGAQAANRTWTGGGADYNWNTAGNWGGTAPVANDLLFFDGTTRLATTNNITASTTFNGITFSNTAGAFTLRGNAIRLGGGVTNKCAGNTESIGLSMALTASRTFDVISGGTLSIGGVISGSTFAVTKVNTGTLALSGVNTYTGGTAINGGTVAITNDNNLGTSGALTFANGGTLLNTGSGAQSSSRAITLNSGGGVISLSGPTLTLTGAITGGGGLTIGGSDLVLQPSSGNNNIGAIQVTSGRLFVFNTGAINASAVTVSSGATIDFGSSASSSPANAITFASGSCIATRLAGTLTLSTATSTFPNAGTMIFNADDSATTNLTVSGAYPALTGDLTIQIGGGAGAPGRVTLSGAISGNYGLLKTSNGLLMLSGANSYAGDTTVSAGTLRLGAANVIPDGSGKGNVTVSGTLDLGGFSETINGLSGSGIVDNAVGTGAYTLTVGNNDQTSTFSGTITDTSGALSLTKIGAGTLTLGGVNSFSGAATVLAGTLSVQQDGGLGSVTGVNVGTGATLTLGSGTSNNYINGAATVGLTNTAVMNLAFTGSDTIANLYINGVHKLAGTWGATGSGATYIDDAHFQGAGVLNVAAGPTSGTAISGSPNPSTLGQSVTFTATVTGTNGVPPLTGTVTFKDGATVLGTGTLSGSPAATATFTTNGLALGSHTITAVYGGDTNFAGSTSGNLTQTVNPTPFTKLQLLAPGETAAPGTTTGKTGTPVAQVAGTPFTVTVNGVDANWNLISTNDTVKITSGDPSASLPANAALVGGSSTFNVTLRTSGATITASNVTHTAIAASVSPPISLGGGVAAVAQIRPLVAIHDSELTRALESLPATGSTPTGAGTTGYQWWPTNWHYFVMPDAVKETLRSDGTAFEVVGDQDISNGRLLASNGQPRCPIFISLASEAIRDDEIAQLTNYVAAGGTLLVGSSAFTRNTDGTARGDFAVANQMGVHMASSGLTNWTANNTLTKLIDHRLTSHLPSGALTWRFPSAAEEVSWGTSPDHPYLAAHSAWRVQSSDASVLAQGDAYPYLMTKPFGKGQFIYFAQMQPMIGDGGFAPTMYSYLIFRRAIEWAFANAKMAVPKVSPWPYAYDAAFVLRRDLENYTNEVAGIYASAQIEASYGATGDYYFCTGTLREDAASAYNTNTIITSLRQAVTNYGTGIYPHNGGLKNPNNPSLVRGQYDYWHWGPDEALDVTPTNYPSGKAYALASMSNSFHDVETWLSGLTNGLRGWCACYFNATREDSYDIQAQLGVNMTGDQKLCPFPHWTLSTRTADKHYAFLSEPPSDWFVSGLVAQSLEPWHPPAIPTTQTLHDGVDFYYNLGALVNFYCHTISTGLGDAGPLALEYVTYSMNTNLHPRLWSANAVKVYQWWQARSSVQITPNTSTNGSQVITTLAISGATDSRTAVEVLVPQTSLYGVQVFTNGIAAAGNSFRTTGQIVRVLVGTSVTNAEIRYIIAPSAQNDLYYATQGSTLAVPAPGVLSNDQGGMNGSLTAALVSGPAHGTLTLSTNGGFTYVPSTNFTGVDSFSYQANDGVSNSAPAIVTICVAQPGQFFADDFTRSGTAAPLVPWQVMSANWTMTNGMLQGALTQASYAFAYVTNSWSNYWVQGRIQFPAGAFGGGLGGRLNPQTGAHYAAWIYPEGSAGGARLLKLFKFATWTTLSYNGSSTTPMQQVSLASVGTNWHTLKLAFHANRIAVWFDGSQVMSVMDVEAQPYTSGGIIADMGSDAALWTMSVDDVAVSPLVVADSYSVSANTTLTVPASGLLTNDTEVYGASLAAVVLNAPTNGTLNLNSNGGFSYSPATNFGGVDTFIYQANDGPTNLGTATVTITVKGPIIVTTDNQARAYGASNPTLTGSLVGVQNGDNITAVYATAAQTNSAVGTYPVTVTLSDPDGKLGNYIVITNNGTLTVNPAPLAVTAQNVARAYGATNPALSGTISGIQNADSIAATYATAATTASPVGGYPITVSLTDPGHKLGNYSVTTNNGTLSVTNASLAVAANNASRAYGATNPPFNGTITGIQNGDSIAATYASPATGSSPAGSYPIIPTLVDPGSKLSNYSVSSINGTLSVTAASLTVAANNTSRSYGATNPAFDGTITGIQNGDNITATYASTATTASPVGSYSITPTLVDPGSKLSNYNVNSTNGTLSVTAASLAVAANNASRSYGATNPVFNGTISGVQNGDDITATYASTATVTNPVGSYPITPTLVDPGSKLSNYSVSSTNGTLSVTAASLAVVANSASRSYGATNPTFSGTITGIENGDDITATYASTATVTNPVGSYPITPTLVDPSSKLSNYNVSSTNGTLSVTAASLAVAANNASRGYGTTNPAFNGTITGIQNGDNITATYASTATVTNPVGNYPITPTLADPGSKLSNYSVSSTNGTLSVTTASLVVAANNASRGYGATNPAFSGIITGIQNGDNITATYASTVTTTSPVGSYPITPTLVDPGSKLSNYSVSSSNGTLSVTVASLAVAANNASRSYGATNPAFNGTITGIQNGDNITATYASAATATSPVGSYPITPTLVDPGSKLSNYSVSSTNGALSVTAANLAVSANNASRSYGATNPAFSGTITGIQNGDNITATYASTATATSPVGSYPITPTLVDPGSELSNYSVDSTNGTLSVTAASLAVAANNASRSYGATNPELSATFSGWVNGEGTNVLGGVLVLSTPAETNSPVGTYPIIPTGLSSTNYALTYTNGTLTVNPAALTVAADPKTKWYGQADPALTYRIIIGGLANGDSLTGSLSRVAGEDAGTYAILQASLAASTNYALTYAGTNLTIWPNWLTVTADDQSRAYGATNPVLTMSYSGFVGAEGITNLTELPQASTTAQPGSPVGDYAITLTGGSATNYRFILQSGVLTITPVQLTVAADDASRPYGATNPVFSGTITGLQNGDDITATYATTATDTSPAGSYPIVPTLVDPSGKLPNYKMSLSNGTLVVTAPTQPPQILSLVRVGSSNVVLTWTAASNSVYRVQYKADLASTNWIDLTPDITASGDTASFTDPPSGADPHLSPGSPDHCYYRVVLRP